MRRTAIVLLALATAGGAVAIAPPIAAARPGKLIKVPESEQRKPAAPAAEDAAAAVPAILTPEQQQGRAEVIDEAQKRVKFRNADAEDEAPSDRPGVLTCVAGCYK